MLLPFRGTLLAASLPVWELSQWFAASIACYEQQIRSREAGGKAAPPFGGMSTPKAASGPQATAPGPCVEEQVEVMPERRLHFSRAASLVRCALTGGQ